MTWLAYAIWIAASAAEVDLAVPCSPATAAAASPPAPKEPKTIAGIDRFIATAIRLVRIEPEAPTIMPATIIAVLFSARPAAAADNPVIALSSEMTTGMSAPPIGNTTNRPMIPASTSTTTIDQPGLPVPACTPMYTAMATAASSSTALEA